MRVLTVNAGSSSVKLRLLDQDDRVLASHDLAAHGIDDRRFGGIVSELASSVDVVGHRIVHGGRDFQDAVVVDAPVRVRLGELADLAPLHQPAGLAGVDVLGELLPGVPAVACFDTAFHFGLPAAAATYPIPAEWRDRYGVRRYGFHGLAHASVTARIGEMLGEMPEKLVVCHLGSGASLAAVRNGRSVDTTMGFTPLDGLVMATRPGSLDPGLLLWLQKHARIPIEELDDQLEHHSGLLALAGTADMREVLANSADGHAASTLALEVYLHRLRASIAAMTAALGGLDVLAFSGGVGEHAPGVRAGAADGLEYLGIELDPERNATATGDTDITASGAATRTLVVTAREDVQIATQVRRCLHRLPAGDRAS